MAEKIKQIVEKMIRKHGTNNPFEIASQKGIVLLFEPLGGIYGYHHTFRRIQIIHINSELDEPTQRFVCAHELGSPCKMRLALRLLPKSNMCWICDLDRACRLFKAYKILICRSVSLVSFFNTVHLQSSLHLVVINQRRLHDHFLMRLDDRPTFYVGR